MLDKKYALNKLDVRRALHAYIGSKKMTSISEWEHSHRVIALSMILNVQSIGQKMK